MTIDSAVFRFAGVMILLGALLTHFVHPAFLWLVVFVGANLLQASFTKFCPAAVIFKKLGLKPGTHFN